MDNRQHRRHPDKNPDKRTLPKKMTNAEYLAFQTVNEARKKMLPKGGSDGTRVLGRMYTGKPATYRIYLTKAERKLPKEERDLLKLKKLSAKRDREIAVQQYIEEHPNDIKS